MAPNATRNRRGSQRGYGNRANKNCTGFKPAGSSDKKVPLLKFGQGNNWLAFKEKMYTACLEKYGDLARLIENEQYDDSPVINDEEFPGWRDDEVMKTLYIGEIKARQKVVRQIKDDQAKMYAYIVSKLSKESMDEFKHHEDYQTVKGDLSVFGLWVVLREIHAINNSSTNLLILKKEAFEKYATCKQGPFEILAGFEVRFDFMYECYVDQGNVEKTHHDRAINFMYALDAARYGEFITEI